MSSKTGEEPFSNQYYTQTHPVPSNTMSIISPPDPPPIPASLPALVPLSKTEYDTAISENHSSIKGTKYDKLFSTSYQEARKAFEIFIKDARIPEEDKDSYIFISKYHPVKPVIQNGPLCGMVALSMATDLLNNTSISTEDIFTEAKNAGYSIQGEMFSAHSMQKLATKFLHGSVQLLQLDCQEEKSDLLNGTDLIEALVDGFSLLVPYDADKNHSPCLAKGHKAHWALVTGFFAAFKKSSLSQIQPLPLERDTEIPSLYHLNNLCTDEMVKNSLKLLLKSPIEFLVFAHQGKSKYCGIWNFNKLLSSNNNLFEVGPERVSDNYVIPNEGIEEGLRAKVVLIQNQCN